MSKWYITKLILLSLLGLSLHEVSNLIYYFNPDSLNIYPENMYISKSYKQPKISVLYYFYELMPYIDNLIKAAILYKVSSFVSEKLRKVAFWFTILYVAQIYFYVYDRNTNFWSNIILYAIIALICITIALPAGKEKARLMSIE